MSLPKIIALLTTLAAAGAAVAQAAAETARPAPAAPGAACPPGVNGDPPTLGGGGSSEPLSEKLAESKGIICPPAGVDPEMQVVPPEGGTLRIIRPPGTPGGDQSVQPK